MLASPAPVPIDVEEFLQHWRAIPKTGLIPSLREFLDFRVFRQQSEVAIIDVVGPTEMRFRLFGTGLSLLAGEDMTGKNLLEQFHPQTRVEALRIIWASVSTPCGYILHRTFRRGAVETGTVGIGLRCCMNKAARFGLWGSVPLPVERPASSGTRKAPS